MRDPRRELLEIYAQALRAVEGRAAVRAHLAARQFAGPCCVIAIGKAAASMYRGAQDALGDGIVRGLVITKRGHAAELKPSACLRIIESGHPVPDMQSLVAGQALLELLAELPAPSRCLFLISGGASSLVEVLPLGLDLEWLARLNEWLLGSGFDIRATNAVRRRVSLIKGGRLRRALVGRAADVLLISDVPGDDPAVIGSGLLAPPEVLALPAGLPGWVEAGIQAADAEFAAQAAQAGVDGDVELRIIASARHLREAIGQAGQARGLPVNFPAEGLAGDAGEAGARIAHHLRGAEAGLHVWTGETTVRLPPQPGRGGRNQHLALAAALAMTGCVGCYLLAAGTDGTDGPTDDAGALVDAGTVGRARLGGSDPEGALEHADAGTCLEAAGDLLQTGPTGTNVMDVVIGLKR